MSMDNAKIREICYELYRVDWMQRVSAESQKDVIRQYAAAVNDYEDSSSLEGFIFENGYDEGSIYVCFDEFLEAEYLDTEYIKELIGEDNPKIYDIYLNDVKSLQEEDEDGEDEEIHRVIFDSIDSESDQEEAEKCLDEAGEWYDYDSGDRMMVYLSGLRILDENEIDYSEV